MSKYIFTDLDGTLTLKDTYIKFIFNHLKFGIAMKNGLKLLGMGIGYAAKMLNDDDVKKRTFSMFFRGYAKEQSLGNFTDEIVWNHKVLERIEEKRKEGYKVIIVTASPDVYVKHICNYLGYDGFISTVTCDDGEFLTGKFDGEVCNFEQKPKRIKAFLGESTPKHTISYGNSSGDFAMLRFCDESYFVNKLDIKRFED